MNSRLAEKPIIFNDSMVRAILDGRKTQTRRPAPISKLDISVCPELEHAKLGEFTSLLVKFQPAHKGTLSTCTGSYWSSADARQWVASRFGPWQVGDLLWVREAWQSFGDSASITPPVPHACQVRYEADGSAQWRDVPGAARGVFPASLKKRPSIHMPRWASRITLRVKRVWVERVQEISEVQAGREGVSRVNARPHESDRLLFADLWDSIYADRYPWHENPYVWCCEFEKVEGGVK